MTDLRTTLQASLGSEFTLEHELSGGGMSRVFVAQDTRLNRRVVVKVLSPELASGISTSRFEREIALAASLQQANIVPVLNTGDIDGLPYYTMPFVEGRSLRARLGEGAVSITEVVSVLKDVARALAYAHERGVVHRDIKPDNVLLSGGTAVVTDFGIAKAISASMTAPRVDDATDALTQFGTALGTPAYMAPEQVAGDPNTDHRADLYAFGCLAYELLASRPPFHGLTAQRLLAAQLSENPKPVSELRGDTPSVLAALVMHCLEKDADRRPQRATDVLRVLDTVTSSSPATLPAALLARPISLAWVLGIWALVIAAAFVLAKAAIVGIGLPAWVLPGALALAGLGLPAMLFTYYVQRVARRVATDTPTLTPGGSVGQPSTLASMALRAAPVVTWRRTGRAGVVIGVVFASIVAIVMALRAFGIGPTASLFAKGVLDANDRVIVSQVSMHGGDTTLAATLTEALREDLAQSHTIALLPPSGVREALARMERPPESVLTPELAREIAQRGAAKLIVAGDMVPLGAGYVVTVRLIDPAKGDPLRSFTQTARDASDVIAAISRVAKDVRAGIGESLRSVQGSERLEQVTTSSLEAFRKYVQAVNLSEGVKLDVERARGLLLDAVRLDSTFAMAYLQLSWLDPDLQRDAVYAIKAHQFRDHLSPVERSLADGMYYWAGINDVDRAISATTDAYRADSLNPHVLTTMSALQYWGRHDPRQALVWAERAARVDSVVAQDYLLWPLLALKRFTEAEQLVKREAAIRGADDSRIAFHAVNVLWAEGKYDSIPSAVLRAHSASSDPWMEMMTPGFQGMLAATRGQLEASGVRMEEWIAAARKIGFPVTEMDQVLQLTRFDVWQRERPQGIRRLDSAVARFKFDSLPPGSRSYLDIADLYAQAKRPDDAKRWLARYDAEVKDSLQRRRDLSARRRSQGYVAIAEGRAGAAISEFRQSLAANNLCPQGSVAAIGLAFDVSGQLDSAQTAYERYLATFDGTCTMGNDAMWRPLILKRLGELHEQKGDRVTAAGYYQRFIDLWQHADPDLQPKVAEVRRRLARLGDREKK